MPDPGVRRFIERTGIALERMGAPRTFGRLFGLLLVADAPLSLAEMAERLGVSKASVSTNARLCEQLGLAQRVSVRGDRRDYYEIGPSSFEKMLGRHMEVVDGLVRLAEEGLKTLDPDAGPAHERLTEMRDFHRFIVDGTKALLGRWDERRQVLSAKE